MECQKSGASLCGQDAGTSASRCALAAALTGGFFVFVNLGRFPLWDWDEAFYAQVALGIARDKTWIAYLDDGRLTSAALKPPLGLWATAVAFRVLGPSNLALRLFPALCYATLVAIVTVFCRRRFNAAVAVLTAFMLSTDAFLVYKHCARAGDMEAPLLLFLTMTMLGWLRACEGARAWPAVLPWSCAVLAKGPAACAILPGAALWMVLQRRWRVLPKFVFCTLLGILPFACFLAVREKYQPGSLRQFLLHETLERLTSGVDGASGNSLYYLRTVLLTGWPVLISLALTAAFVGGRFRMRRQLTAGTSPAFLALFLACWALGPFVVFTLARTKHDWYVYPALVPAYMLAAWALRAGWSRLERCGRTRRSALAALFVFGGMGLPAFWETVNLTPPSRRRLAEDALLVRAAREAPRGSVVLYRPYPTTRFLLARAGVQYTLVHEPVDLPACVLGRSRPTLLVYRTSEEAVVTSRLADMGLHILYEMPTRGRMMAEVGGRGKTDAAYPTTGSSEGTRPRSTDGPPRSPASPFN